MRSVPHIVLGESDSGRRHAVALALRQEGYEVMETDDGRDVLSCTEYLAAMLGRRRKPGAIAADSFAIVAGPTLPSVDGVAVRDILERARWDIPVIVLPERADDGSDLDRLRTLLREALAVAPAH
jgi:DNA-binding response OmpR family regulator